LEVWLKPLANDEWALTILNRGKVARPFTLDWKTFSVTDALSNRTLNTDAATYKIRDIWRKKDAGDTKKALKATIPAFDVLSLKLSLPPKKK
jgi:alpha-galactosidase